MYKGRDAVKIWSFPRRSIIPPMIRDGVPQGWAMKPDPSWGDPDANFPFDPDLCDYKPHFDAHRIVFDLTFCVSMLFALLVTHGLPALFSPRATGLAMPGIILVVHIGRSPATTVRPSI